MQFLYETVCARNSGRWKQVVAEARFYCTLSPRSPILCHGLVSFGSEFCLMIDNRSCNLKIKTHWSAPLIVTVCVCSSAEASQQSTRLSSKFGKSPQRPGKGWCQSGLVQCHFCVPFRLIRSKLSGPSNQLVV